MAPEGSDEDLGNLSNEELTELLKRWELLANAAEEHIDPKEGSTVDLALGFKAWHHMNTVLPNWRQSKTSLPPDTPLVDPDKPESYQAFLKTYFEFQALRNRAARFENQWLQGLMGPNRAAFCRNLSDALRLPDPEIIRIHDTTAAVILAWKELGGLSGNRPTKKQLRGWVEARLREAGELPLLSEREWRRIWQDPFIAALLRGS